MALDQALVRIRGAARCAGRLAGTHARMQPRTQDHKGKIITLDYEAKLQGRIIRQDYKAGVQGRSTRQEYKAGL